MSTFTTPVVRVLHVEDHPNADRLSIVKVLGYTCISGKLEDGSHRYKAGDLVVYIPSASLLPEWLLKEMDFWDKEKDMGGLSGSAGNRVKPMKLRGIFSEGVLYNVKCLGVGSSSDLVYSVIGKDNEEKTFIFEGNDVSEFLGIEKYSPPIPEHMAGEVANLYAHTVKYDFEKLESVPDMFADEETVSATEKLHGTFCAICYVPGLNHPEMFGTNGEIIVHSKGLGAQGLAFKNVSANDGNLYVRMLRKLLENGLEDKLRTASFTIPFEGKRYHAKMSILGEIFGGSVQDLKYGLIQPEFRVFDVWHEGINDWFSPKMMKHVCECLGLEPVPELYTGPFNKSVLETYRDGKTTFNGANVREGIVIRSTSWERHPLHGRKIAKMISPDYLLRKVKNGEATEFN